MPNRIQHALAQILSYVLHPGIMPTYGTIYVLYSHPNTYHWPLVLHTLISIFLGTYLAPLLAIFVLKQTGIIESIHLIRREDRIYPYIASTACMLATANYLAGRHLPIEISLSVYASAFVILISAILLPFWKSSAHLAGLSGFLALYIGMNAHYSTGNTTTLVTIVALIGLMAWSRLSLNRHTPRELLSGFFIGFTTLYVLLSR